MRLRSRLPTLAAICLAALAPLAAHPQPGTPAGPVITIRNFDFAPMSVTVPVGGSVTWRNLDPEPHTVTSTDGVFRSGGIDQGESYTFRFTRPGTYAYLCSIHPQMRAVVVVK